MAEFYDVMREYRRLCEAQDSNGHGKGECKCKKCPLDGNSFCDTEVSEMTDDEIEVIEDAILQWAVEHPELIYPTWKEYLANLYGAGLFCEPLMAIGKLAEEHIPGDIAEKLGIEPKEERGDE